MIITTSTSDDECVIVRVCDCVSVKRHGRGAVFAIPDDERDREHARARETQRDDERDSERMGEDERDRETR